MRGRSVLIFFQFFFWLAVNLRDLAGSIILMILSLGFSIVGIPFLLRPLLFIVITFQAYIQNSNRVCMFLISFCAYHSRVCLPRASTFMDPYADRS